MAGVKGIFAFSPELGDSEEGSKGFYIKPEVQKSVIKTDYPLVKFFLDMHLPAIDLIRESDSEPKRKILREKKPSVKTLKSRGGEMELEFFNKSMGHFKDVKLLFAFQGQAPNKLYFANSEVEERLDSKDIKWAPLGFSKFGEGILTNIISIRKRSYFYIKADRTIGNGGNFVLMIERDGTKLTEFRNLARKDAVWTVFMRKDNK